jgi:hypothetical protein
MYIQNEYWYQLRSQSKSAYSDLNILHDLPCRQEGLSGEVLGDGYDIWGR